MKKIFLLLILLLIGKIGNSQEIDTITNFNNYTIKSLEIKNILNEVIELANDCPLFSELGKKKFISLFFPDTALCRIIVLPQNVTSLCMFRSHSDPQTDGICFYEDEIIYVNDFSNCHTMEKYFSKEDSTVSVYFDHTENYHDNIYPANIYIEIFYRAIENKFVMDTTDVDTEAWCGMNNRITFEYIIKKDDTWKTISEKCHCDERNLREEYPEYEKPISGLLLCVRYIFDKNGHYCRVQRVY